MDEKCELFFDSNVPSFRDGAAQHYDHKWWNKNRELTLKCKLKCYAKPMKDLLGVSPSEGNQGKNEVKKKFF